MKKHSKKQTQLKFFPTPKTNTPGKRKSARPISLRGANHITLRSNSFILRKNHRTIKKILQQTQTRYDLKLRTLAIMSNHIHLLAKVPNRKAFANAMRYLASQIALRINKKQKFWCSRAWSRPVASRKDLVSTERYIFENPIRENIFTLTIDSYLIQNGFLQNKPDLSFFRPPEKQNELELTSNRATCFTKL